MIEIATDPERFDRCLAIRLEVFVGEQRVPHDEEVDAIDSRPETVHLLAGHAERDLGTLRLHAEGPGRCRVGRVAVTKSARGRGVGRELMARAAEIALERFARDGRVEIVLSAQEGAMGFYRACGYEEVPGERYLEAGIWHRDMAACFAVG